VLPPPAPDRASRARATLRLHAALAQCPPCAPHDLPLGPASLRACAWPLPRPTGRAAAASCSHPPAPSPAPRLAQRLRSFRASRQRLGRARAPLGPLRALAQAHLRPPPARAAACCCCLICCRMEKREGGRENEMQLPVEKERRRRQGKKIEEKGKGTSQGLIHKFRKLQGLVCKV
jgi:hypothetical protein